ncbi:MAG: lysine--tRNA ligase [Sphaerochaetaceae bacterium]|nr:lysine--tRNA ligase [Sphaerochaetaceae bacterium]MDD3162482.1 lysine--tRNA ligase [Sphaerochaetaceae bacterium]MDD4006810.1 lysine--tRNA ligase [Sphaerochaetaceae bacterium]MDD4396077.1 lysine--tRNA ligase [Sphaerochaetaceae bacterium]
MEQNSLHWADICADKIIREKGPKDLYTCASGITPSGTVHIGNFREIISVDLVVRALRAKGCNVRFIYSWDDYDVFRKVPKNMPDQDELAKYLRMPITSVPDMITGEKSYARANEVAVEKMMPLVGISPEYLYQSDRYRSSMYAEGMRNALVHREEIRKILNEFRTEPLPENWWPVSVFSGFTGRDTTTVTGWDGEWGVTYHDDETGQSETVDLRKTGLVKLHWRVDWPMRWAREHVDFEPAGKDHHSQGGSFDTSRQVVELYNAHAPVSFKYDFITFKGKGKQSSSLGNVDTLGDVLHVYIPEIARYMFASTRPSAEFSISFDLDVLKIYEDYENCERIYFHVLPVNDKRYEKEKRIFELSQIDKVPDDISYQIPFRHLCNLLQVHEGDIDRAMASLTDLKPSQVDRLRAKCVCAWHWICDYAPDDFKFSLAKPSDPLASLSDAQKKAIQGVAAAVETMDGKTDKEFTEQLYAVAADAGLETPEFFLTVYTVLISKEKGPKLAQFIKACGRDKILPILSRY